MKLSCLQENLNGGLAVTGRAIAGRSAEIRNPNLLLKTDRGKLMLLANGGQTCVQTSMGAMIEEEGSAVVPHKLLSDLVQSLPSDRIDIELTGGADGQETVMHVACSRAYARMATGGMHETPPEPTRAAGKSLKLRGNELADAIAKTAFSAADATDRPSLTAINMEIEDGTMVLATSDGHRLTVHQCPVHTAPEGDDKVKILAPAATMRDVARLMGDSEDVIELTLGEDGEWVSFENSETIVHTRQIKATYPNYEQLIPESWVTRLVVDVADLRQATQQAAIFANAGSNIIRLVTKQGEAGAPALLEVSSRSEDVGRNQGVIEIKEMEGDDNRVAINVRYLTDVINIAGKDRLTIEITNASSPVVFTAENTPHWKNISMPMYVQW